MDVRTICLGILTRGDATGYEIKKLFEDGRFSYFVEASFGSIYPALSRLTDEGLVSVRAEAGVRRPDRKVYSITEKGRSAFIASLNEPLPDDRFRSPFLFAMMFSDFLDQDRVITMIDGYIADTEAKLAQITCDCGRPCNPREAFVCGMGRTVYQAILAFLKERRNEFNADVAKTAAE
jgi:PadR family transcriptional regulator, regulatory protein AphA